jgi:hypothetical protein
VAAQQRLGCPRAAQMAPRAVVRKYQEEGEVRKALTAVVLVAALLLVSVWVGAPAEASWSDKVTLKGDFRYRNEYIDQQDKTVRNRWRFRARLMTAVEVTEDLDFGLQLASGSDDPVSTNQTVDNAFSSKGIWLDLAYCDIHHHNLPGLSIMAGKMKNPYDTHEGFGLVWDGDLRPEGLAVKYAKDMESMKLMAAGGWFWIDEVSSGEDDTFLFGGEEDIFLYGAQAGLGFDLSQANVMVGAGYYTYADAKGNGPFVGHAGNSADTAGAYMYDFNELELFGQAGFKAGAMPVTVHGSFVTNSDPDENNTGFLFGVKVGKKKAPGSWELGYNYRQLEADAVLADFTDSDFGGGGTDANGHQVTGTVCIMDKTDLGVTALINKLGIGDNGAEADYTRIQLDLKFKF